MAKRKRVAGWALDTALLVVGQTSEETIAIKRELVRLGLQLFSSFARDCHYDVRRVNASTCFEASASDI